MRNTGLLRRLGAILYDTLLVAALLMLATVPFVAVRGGEPVEPGNYLYQAVLVLVTWAFFVGYWVKRGRTLGMQAWRIQIEDSDGELPGVGACTLRFLAAGVSWACFGLGFLWQLWDPESLTWHDRASGTRLVYYPKL
ncbi:MAG: RDD family protein [Woeseiaceae bacterium]|nr:RDD family protein [Woeseiaceae bacterium]